MPICKARPNGESEEPVLDLPGCVLLMRANGFTAHFAGTVAFDGQRTQVSLFAIPGLGHQIDAALCPNSNFAAVAAAKAALCLRAGASLLPLDAAMLDALGCPSNFHFNQRALAGHHFWIDRA